MSDSLNPRPDVVVVGAGIVGLWSAWHLLERGLRPLVLDPLGIGSGQTAVQPGGVRTQWTSELTCSLALESKVAYDSFDEVIRPSVSPGFDACGYAFVAQTEETLQRLAEDVRRQNEFGVSSTMITLDDLEELVPGLSETDALGAAYCAADGYFDRPLAVPQGLADAIAARGGEFRTERAVEITGQGGGWVVRTEHAAYDVPHVVVAAGLASDPLTRTPEFALPLTPSPRFLFYSNPIRERIVEPLLAFEEAHFAIKQMADGCVLASDLSLQSTGPVEEQTWRRSVTRRARELVPVLDAVTYPVMATGSYDVTPDAQLIVGQLPDRPGLLTATGMNGRGMMLAPAVGRLIADAVTAPDPSTAVPPGLSPARFLAGGTLEPEGRVI